MSDITERETNNLFPYFLVSCIEQGIIDRQTAFKIDKIIRSCDTNAPVFNGSVLDPQMTFESLIFSQENAFALRLAKMIAKGEADPGVHNPLYIHGSTGIGKTHLLSAIANEAVPEEVLFFNVLDFEVRHESALRPDKTGSFFRWLQSHNILIIDDIQNTGGNKVLQRDIGVTIDRYMSSGRFIVVSGDLNPQDLNNIDDWLKSRLAGGIKVELKMVNLSERKDVLRRSIDDKEIPEDVIDYLASKMDNSVRQLKAAAKQLKASASILNEPITIEKAEAIINNDRRSQERITQLNVSNRNDMREEIAGGLCSDSNRKRAEQFKKMMDDAETEEEQALALQIAVGERVRQLREENNSDPRVLVKLERALELIREGKTDLAIQCMSSKSGDASNVS